MKEWKDVYIELPKATKEREGNSNYKESNIVLVKNQMGLIGTGIFVPTKGWKFCFIDDMGLTKHIITQWKEIE